MCEISNFLNKYMLLTFKSCFQFFNVSRDAQWTLMAYMIEGGGSKTMSNAKKWLYKHSEATSLLLQKLTNVIVDYLVAQVRAGAQVCQ